MSTLPNAYSPADQRLPEAWVNRLFDRFFALYGVTKVTSMWEGLDLREVKGMWATELGRFDAQTLGRAMRTIIDSGREWPPTIPEFVAACLDVRPPPASPGGAALPDAGCGHTDNETARQNLARIHQMLASAIKRPAMGGRP